MLLTPGQFFLTDYYQSQLDQITTQILSLQQPSVVSIQHYTPTDADYASSRSVVRVPTQLSDSRQKLKEKVIAPIQSDNDTSLDNTIFSLEEEIREKEDLVRQL
jgi:hypothetical protein